MPMRRVIVEPRGREPESDIYRNFADLSLADKHTYGRSYRAGDHYSSSEPERETRNPGRAYKSPAEPSYHGPHFEKGPTQEKLWNERGCKDVWDPRAPLRPVATRPETYGRAHSIHQSIMDKPKLSDPYEKRPVPYTKRVKADYESYKDPSEDYGKKMTEMRAFKGLQVGRNIYPEDSVRDQLLRGKEVTETGRCMANQTGQSRAGFIKKYPQAYEDPRRIDTHVAEALNTRVSAGKLRRGEREIDGKLKAWETQRERQSRR